VAKFRKKPVVIEARQWDPHKVSSTRRSLLAWMNGAGCNATFDAHEAIYVPTLEGQHMARPGDWIIQGVKGEFYPCKPDIFEMTYEPAEGATPCPPAPPIKP
jgi:hypothetical protein